MTRAVCAARRPLWTAGGGLGRRALAEADRRRGALSPSLPACTPLTPHTTQPLHTQKKKQRRTVARAGAKVDEVATANALDFDELTDVIR
jgi:hypothetical protein